MNQPPFNVSCFGRYGEDLLIRQFDKRNDKEVTYGVYFVAKFGERGGLYGTENHLKAFSKNVPENFVLNIVEVGSGASMIRAKDEILELYGHKAAFGLVEAHGSPFDFQIGDESTEDGIVTADIFKELSLLFENKAPIAFNSCCVGVRGGLAQQASEYGMYCIGPIEPAGARSIISKFRDGAFTGLSVDFDKLGIKMTYFNGRSV